MHTNMLQFLNNFLLVVYVRERPQRKATCLCSKISGSSGLTVTHNNISQSHVEDNEKFISNVGVLKKTN